MATTDITQRIQYERLELGIAKGSPILEARSKRAVAVYTALALPAAAVMGWVALSGIDTWWQAVVFGVIVATTIGLMIAVSPNREW
jgi:hypothetical protein